MLNPMEIPVSIGILFSVYVIIQCVMIFALAMTGDAASGTPRAISVLIPFRDEANHLPILIDALASQQETGAAVEIIFINDQSQDHSADIVSAALDQFKNASLIHVQVTDSDRLTGKKRALQQGIEKASNDILVFTDADCEPPADWLRSMAAAFSDDTDAVIGSSILHGDGVVGRFARSESIFNHIIGVFSATLGKPFMATGRNWAYHRRIFERVNGFTDIATSPSGDDDLLLSRFRLAGATVQMRPDIHVTARAPKSMSDYVRQKTRHLSAVKMMPFMTQMSALFYHGLHFAVVVSIILYGMVFYAIYKLFVDYVLFRTARFRFDLPRSHWFTWFSGYWIVIPWMALRAYLTRFDRIQWKS